MPTAFRRTSSDLAADPISLTVTHVSAVPRRNNERYIATYVQGQSALLKQWASEGAKEAASWDTPSPDAEHDSLLKVTEGGFGSPILKARVPDKSNKSIRGPTQQSEALNASICATQIKEAAAHPTKAREQDKGRLEDAHSSTKKSRTHSKKRPTAAHSDSEVEKRLSERRERKKLRRNIMSPEVSDTESKDDTNKGKKARKASAKTPTGFALMHGFSATNVGKNRLTLDRILQNTGVFGKGKASSVKKIVKNGKPTVFSESDFLKKGSKSTTKTKSRQRCAPPSLVKSSSSSSSYSSSSLSSIPHKSKTAKGQKKRRHPRSPAVSLDLSRVSSHSTAPYVQIRPAYDPANSIVWDIEKDSHLSAPVSKIGTILVKVPHTFGRGKDIQSGAAKDRITHAEGTNDFRNDSIDHAEFLDGHTARDRSSVLSLGPSESASHTGKALARHLQAAIVATSTSKYFRPADIPGDLSPANDPSGPSMCIYEPHNGILVASTQTVAPLEDLYTFQSTLEPTRYFNSNWNLDCKAPIMNAQDRDPLSHSPDEPCFWSQVGYDIDPQEGSPLYNNPDVCLHDDYADSSGPSHSQEHDDLSLLYDIGPTSLRDDTTSLGDYHCEKVSAGDPLLVLDMDVACEEDYTIHHDQDMEYIPITQASRWAESPILSVMEEQDPIEIESGRDFAEDDVVGETSVACSELSTASADLVPFQQGRGLLRGLGMYSSNSRLHSLSNTEVEVAGNLRRNHWLPQRF